jgi:hypothetical protein
LTTYNSDGSKNPPSDDFLKKVDKSITEAIENQQGAYYQRGLGEVMEQDGGQQKGKKKKKRKMQENNNNNNNSDNEASQVDD